MAKRDTKHEAAGKGDVTSEFPFPFFGAGDASYFELVNVMVVLTREPSTKEQKAIVDAAPDLFEGGITATRNRLVVFLGEEGGDFIAEEGSDAINQALDAWLLRCHEIVPILAVFRPEDFESSGTSFSAWHAWSVEQLGGIEEKLRGIPSPIGQTDLLSSITAQVRRWSRKNADAEDAARARVAQTLAEWDPAHRARELAALYTSAKERTKGRVTLPMPDFAALPKPATTPPATAVSELVAEEPRIHGGLGLVVYLAAAPTKDEILATFRAFRKRFPLEGPYRWKLAHEAPFLWPSSKTKARTSKRPDDEPFAEALHVAEDGAYGVQIAFPGRADEPPRAVLHLQTAAPEPAYEDDDDDDDDGGDDQASRKGAALMVWLPTTSPEALRAFALDVADTLPITSGRGGYLLAIPHDADGTDDDGEGWNLALAWNRRFLALDLLDTPTLDADATTSACGAGWLTLLGRPFVKALDEASALDLPPDVQREDREHATLLVAGALSLGDVARGEPPLPIAEVARRIHPVALTSLPTRQLDRHTRRFVAPLDYLPWRERAAHDMDAFVADLARAAESDADAPLVNDVLEDEEHDAVRRRALRALAGSAKARGGDAFVDVAEAAATDGDAAALALLRSQIDTDLGNEIAMRADRLMRAKKFEPSIALWDLALIRPDLSRTHYVNASWAVQTDNSALPHQVERTRRIFAACRERALEVPAVWLNLVCILYELDDHDAAFATIEKALESRSVGPSQFEKEPVIKTLLASPRFAAAKRRFEESVERPDNLTTIAKWKVFVEESSVGYAGGLGGAHAGVHPSKGNKLTRARYGKASVADKHLREFATTVEESILAVYAEDGGDGATGPVVLVTKKHKVWILGDDVVSALAVIAHAGERPIEKAFTLGASGLPIGSFTAWLSPLGGPVIKDVVKTVAAARDKHAAVMEAVKGVINDKPPAGAAKGAKAGTKKEVAR